MASPLKDVAAMPEGAQGEKLSDTADQAHVATHEEGNDTAATTAIEGRQENQEREPSDDESEGEIPFEPFDINDDGRILKTASQCSRGSWKRPEAGWDVTVTVHRFCELSPSKEEATPTDTDGVKEVHNKDAREIVRQVEPESLQLEFRLGEDEEEGFPQEVLQQANAAGVELHPLLHCGIETMGKNELATFVVTAEGVVDDAQENAADSSSKPPVDRRFEYVISLNDWMEEVDLSERQDNSLMKRVLREGDGVTRPVEIGGVTVRCRVVRMPIAQDPAEQQQQQGDENGETVVFDNLQSQEEAPGSNGDDDGVSDGLKGPLSFVLDDCPFGPGVMAVVKSMSKSEQCDAWLDPKHGPVDHLDDGRFYHQVVLELVEVEELPPAFAAEEVRLEMSSRFKVEGNEKFIAGDYPRASRRYEKAIKYADGVPPGQDSEDGGGDKDETSSSSSDTTQANDDTNHSESRGGTHGDKFIDLQVAVLCNQAACFLKMGQALSALAAAERASSLKAVAADCPAGIKAAYRRACALEAVGDWGEARRAFRSVLDVDPKNSQCRQGLARLARAAKAYEANLRKTFGGCLASDKLKGFASEGREMPESSPRPGNDDDFYGGRGPDQDGQWTDGSESGSSESGGESSSDGGDEEKEKQRVNALYDLATREDGGGGEATAEDSTTVTDATEPEKEAASTVPAAAAAGAAPCSEPATACEVIPLSSLPDLAKEFAVAGDSTGEADGLAGKECASNAEAQAGDVAAEVVPP
ncbi:unnamed protein product [Ectocarpus sp. 4 AP-2014]